MVLKSIITPLLQYKKIERSTLLEVYEKLTVCLKKLTRSHL